MFIISFDYGTQKIGVAIGQKITCTATTLLKTIKVVNGIPNWNKIQKILNEWQPKIAVVGYPLNMDGTEQFFSIKTKIFALQLQKKFSIKVFMHDERLTTIEAKNKIFLDMKNNKKNKLNKIDSISAAFILESWMREN